MRTSRKLVAILSADVVGYSRLMGDDDRTTLASLMRVRKAFSAQVERHRGRVVDATGDAMLAEFGSAVDAVGCAVAIQRERTQRMASLPAERRMLLRIGVDLGDVIERESALYGDAVNIAARLQGLSEPGGVCVSGPVHDQADGRLPLAFIFAGEQAIKNIAKPVRAYHVAGVSATSAGGDAIAFSDRESSAAAGPACSTNLPAAADPLLGRDADVAELTQQLGEHRLITVLGAGGIGKTRLAQEVARRLADGHADGVWWVDLTAVESAHAIALAVANAASLQLGHGDAIVWLVRALVPRRTLLVLDNCEHVAAEVAHIVQQILGAAPNVRVLATSQEVLKVPGEHLYRLAGLAVPPPATPLEAARAFGAVQLLEQRARAVDRRFALTPANVADAIELCRHLDGIALAIEMAAARLPLVGLEGLGTPLGERLRLLRSGASRGVPGRQQTLRATLDWSYSLLRSDEQAVLARLSVFAGSFRLDMAQRVAALAPADHWDALDALMALVDKSLVQVESVEPPRYRLLETMRSYAAEKLTLLGEVDADRRRHADALASLAEELEWAFWSTPDAPWLARYAPDYGDLQLAFEHACQRQDAEAAAPLAAALLRLDQLRNVNPALRSRAEAALALLPAAGPRAKAILWTCIAPHGLSALTTVPRLTAAREAVTAWRGVDDARHLYLATGFLASECSRAAEIDAADGLLSEMFGLEQASWPPRLRMRGAAHAGAVSANRGDADGYRRCSRIEIELAEQAGAYRAVAWARLKLADAALMAGDADEAIDLGRQTVEALRALDQPSNLGLASSNLCAALLMAGDIESARAAAMQALPLMWQSDWGYLALDPIARFAALTGQHAPAGRLLGYVDAWYLAHQSPRQPNEIRLAELTGHAVAAALGSAELLRLRAEGAQLGDTQALALAQEVLACAA